jgi:hypothetical protein
LQIGGCCNNSCQRQGKEQEFKQEINRRIVDYEGLYQLWVPDLPDGTFFPVQQLEIEHYQQGNGGQGNEVLDMLKTEFQCDNVIIR